MNAAAGTVDRTEDRTVDRTDDGTAFVARPVRCVIDHLYRDIAIARDCVAGRFTHAGVALEFGNQPDWMNGGLAHDKEWRIEWVKFYEGLSLAHAYAETGDSTFLRTWEHLIGAAIEQIPVGHDSSDVSARRIQNWIYSWNRFQASPFPAVLRDGFAEQLATRLRADLTHLRNNLTKVRNHRTLELYALIVGAVAVGTRDEIEDALALLADNAATDIGDDGVHCERSSDYHCIVLRSLLGAIAIANDEHIAVPVALRERANAACTVAMHIRRPDGITPALSDGDLGDFAALLAFGSELLDRPDLAWAASSGTRGVAPAKTNATFPIGGYATQRSGWGTRRPMTQELWSVIDTGPLGDGGHGHYDHLSVELYASGRPIIVDPGRYTYADGPDGWRHWFKGTRAHNTVTVDGLDQTTYARSKPKGPVSSAALVSRTRGNGRDEIVARAVSPNYDAIHTRTLTLVDDSYWIVRDELRAPTSHVYEARWHFTPEALGQIRIDRRDDATIATIPGARIIVNAVDGRAPEVFVEDGWFSPEYGIKHPAPVLVVRAEGTNTDFLHEIRPLDELAAGFAAGTQ